MAVTAAQKRRLSGPGGYYSKGARRQREARIAALTAQKATARTGGTAAPASTSSLGSKLAPKSGSVDIVGSATTTTGKRAGNTRLTGISQKGRIVHTYNRPGGGGTEKVVMDEAGTAAELASLPKAIQDEVRRRIRRAKGAKAASTGGAQAPA